MRSRSWSKRSTLPENRLQVLTSVAVNVPDDSWLFGRFSVDHGGRSWGDYRGMRSTCLQNRSISDRIFDTSFERVDDDDGPLEGNHLGRRLRRGPSAGRQTLEEIARELVSTIRRNASIDRTVLEQAELISAGWAAWQEGTRC